MLLYVHISNICPIETKGALLSLLFSLAYFFLWIFISLLAIQQVLSLKVALRNQYFTSQLDTSQPRLAWSIQSVLR